MKPIPLPIIYYFLHRVAEDRVNGRLVSTQAKWIGNKQSFVTFVTPSAWPNDPKPISYHFPSYDIEDALMKHEIVVRRVKKL